VKKIKAALFRRLQVMENKIHFEEENELTDWLNGPFMSEMEYDEAMADYNYIIERRLEQEKMKTIQEIKTIFEQILSEVLKINGISVDSAVQVSTVILQESGKYNRCPEGIADDNKISEEVPATFNQKKAMPARIPFWRGSQKATEPA